MSDEQAFSVDLDKLENLAARIRGFAGLLSDQLAAIDQKVKEVDAASAGAAMAAYREAHGEWLRGATDIREGLTALEEAVKLAHDGYTGAVAEGLRILGV
ncbi:WXG100 family type VII secretion target [Nocardia implantans]|uniref:WXG100 family type VII secretion target n=1 Tax=Nocardia implantans TaxID=3108168 RepID=A0ABU6AW97_9NOCA|nr:MULTISPECIES: WXG100 family type VII secretion target [unclassified Nocardia]MBF6192883.1 WXG100 family type VII secretion target [Nocardia beijingensis]MEA3531399.1 WXG100 family type VII secretion target [Nocardia sp. CDC192]MEB3511746.1 WXG100 family type VII secretion target [Nocardia sp. CDC186]